MFFLLRVVKRVVLPRQASHKFDHDTVKEKGYSDASVIGRRREEETPQRYCKENRLRIDQVTESLKLISTRIILHFTVVAMEVSPRNNGIVEGCRGVADGSGRRSRRYCKLFLFLL